MMSGRFISFTDAIRLGFGNYFRFSGRAQRAEYWWFYLFILLGFVGLGLVDGALFGWDNEDALLSGLFYLATFIPLLSAGWRRLHDTGRSGWWLLLPWGTLIWAIVGGIVLMSSDMDVEGVGITVIIGGTVAAFAASIYVIVLLATDSDVGPNRFGPSPKYGPDVDAELAPHKARP